MSSDRFAQIFDKIVTKVNSFQKRWNKRGKAGKSSAGTIGNALAASGKKLSYKRLKQEESITESDADEVEDVEPKRKAPRYDTPRRPIPKSRLPVP